MRLRTIKWKPSPWPQRWSRWQAYWAVVEAGGYFATSCLDHAEWHISYRRPAPSTEGGE